MIDQLVPYEGQLKIHDEKPGAYVIFHEATGMVYVGSSSKPGLRLSRHKTLLKGKCHVNKAFQVAYDACNRLRHVVYLVADRDAAYELEQALTDYYVELTGVFNVAVLDVRKPGKGVACPPEHREAMSVARTGVKLSDDVRRRISEGALAACWVRTPEQREHLSKLKKGKAQPAHIQELLYARNAARAKEISIDGVVYESVREAVRKIGVDRRVVGRRLKNTKPEWTEWFYM